MQIIDEFPGSKITYLEEAQDPDMDTLSEVELRIGFLESDMMNLCSRFLDEISLLRESIPLIEAAEKEIPYAKRKEIDLGNVGSRLENLPMACEEWV